MTAATAAAAAAAKELVCICDGPNNRRLATCAGGRTWGFFFWSFCDLEG